MRRDKDFKSQEGMNNRIRSKLLEELRRYVRDMYIYGHRDREEYASFAGKSNRTIDSYRAKIDGLFGDFQHFEKKDGGLYAICIDGRKENRNPLYKMWKAKSFTEKDLFLHMAIMSLAEYFEDGLTLNSFIEFVEDTISAGIEDQDLLASVEMDRTTMQNKLNEYAELGLLRKEKHDKEVRYFMTLDGRIDKNMLQFASEVLPCGVVGSYLLDRETLFEDPVESTAKTSPFTFKHHILSQALDSEVMQLLLDAINNRSIVVVEIYDRNTNDYSAKRVVPLKIMRNVQTGRQYAGMYDLDSKEYKIMRLDYIRIDNKSFCKGGAKNFQELQAEFEKHEQNVWGVSSINLGKALEKVDFTLATRADEKFIVERLYRERRNGRITDLGDGYYKFEIEVYDSLELIPWINTFIGRITEINFENKEVEKIFYEHLNVMYGRYLDE